VRLSIVHEHLYGIRMFDLVTHEERKKVFDAIKNLVKPEQESIFRIIRKSNEKYTENSNGIFFDLSTVSDETFYQIKDYLTFCSKTRQEHDSRIKELENLRTENQQLLNEHSTK
jgi:pyruvate/2-oxoacid:ferredoxin oxidoreductase beta subunit